MRATRFLLLSLLCAAFGTGVFLPRPAPGEACSPVGQCEVPDSDPAPAETSSQYEYGTGLEGSSDLLHGARNTVVPPPRFEFDHASRGGDVRPPHQEVSTPPPKPV